MAWTYHNKPPMGWPLDYDSGLADFVGAWFLLEGSGNKVFDLSGNGNVGTLVNDAHFVSGKYGHALDFDGTGDIVRTADLVPSLEVTNVTVIVCARSSNWGALQTVVWKHNSSTSDQNYYIRPVTDKIVCGIYAGGAAHTVTGNTTLIDDEWYHLAMTYDGETLKAYVDGLYDNQNTDPTGSLRTGVKKLTIGCRDNLAESFLGQIDYVMIYNRALSASEIAKLNQFPFYGFMNPDEIPVFDQYYSVGIPILRRRREGA